MKKAMFGMGLFLCAFIFLNGSSAHAISPSELKSVNKPLSLATFGYGSQEAESTPKLETTKEPPKNPAPVSIEKAPVQHIVAGGESLTMIAEKYASSWTRLFAKNTQLADPNIINVGETIIVPTADEQLPERPLPIVQPPTTPIPAAGQSNPGYVPTYGGSSAGNTYSAGYCTWYAKNRRPDLPNSLGNADTWVYRAQAMGLATGSVPRAGAIGQQGMHVVYVESVNGNGTVTISEMNYQGLYVTSSRTVAAGNFMYIY